ncbi:hypothetical protein CKO44_03390 [Rubrivivax gelatinosus]|uniref:Uncharacterized protein n=1 Tax=Rubrivivax gelatinosus TaxID=28068 RepID=A0ABS1DP02_RUBGE|nr:hypothetical protein [Rubrivivax gelatinosus]MBK1612507.1 hypothetical protein [Rubrivivax gelatinosus]MBK1711742.1 hypothetical protein [Rubrivivax gelatinosus]
MVEKVFAAIGLSVCVALLLGMLIGRGRVQQMLMRARAAWRWSRQRRSAEREAVEVIERARRGGTTVQREGNIYRPSSFNGRRADDHQD